MLSVVFFFPDSFTFSLSPSSRPPTFSLNTLLLLPVILPAYSSPSVYQSVCSSCLYNIYQSWLTHLPSLLLISGRLSCLSYKHSLRAVFKGARNRVIAWIKPWWSQMTVNINGLKLQWLTWELTYCLCTFFFYPSLEVVYCHAFFGCIISITFPLTIRVSFTAF